MLSVIRINSTHQFIPVLAYDFEKYSQFWSFNCEVILVLYHGPFHPFITISLSVKLEVFFSIIHDNPTRWSTAYRTKLMMDSFNPSFWKFVSHRLSPLLHLMESKLVTFILSSQILIENIWKLSIINVLECCVPFNDKLDVPKYPVIGTTSFLQGYFWSNILDQISYPDLSS